MVALFLELWFNVRMLKSQAINLLGGSPGSAAASLGVSYQAVNKWPDQLPDRIADRVLGACVRRGISVPDEYMDNRREPSVAQTGDLSSKVNAAAPLTADPELEADLAKAEQAGLVLLPKKAQAWDGIKRRHHVRRSVDRERMGLDIGNAGQGV